MFTLYCMTHKKIEDNRIPTDRTMMLVGAYNKDLKDYIRDDVDENISNKNSSYCELTGLYSIWKNDNKSEYVGLEHYRRLFSSKNLNLFKYKVIKKDKIEGYLKDYDIILPKKHCWPEFTNLRDEYYSAHIKSDYEKLEALIKSDFSEYSEAWDKYNYNNNWSYNYNMFVCKKKLIDEYCEFLFSVLFKLEPSIDLNDGRDVYQQRVFGFLSERLFNVWIIKKENLKIKEIDVATLGDKNFYDTKRRIYRHFKWRKSRKNYNKAYC